MIPDLFNNQPVQLPKCGTWPASVHLFDQDSADAILAAWAAERPLLVQGEPGAGKSQLARAAAVRLGRAFISHVVHARTEAQDLQWEFDAVARLGEAQVLGSNRSDCSDRTPQQQQQLAPRRFLCPGPLWWAFGWDSARTQNADPSTVRRVPEPWHPEGWHVGAGAVLLIDEIDKAEADLPNSLLETLGNGGFTVPWLDDPVSIPAGTDPPLVIITTNRERELPRAFLRRCLVLTLDLPEKDDALKALLVERGRQHLTDASGQRVHDDILELVAGQLITDRKLAKERACPVPGQAEYLDILRALDKARRGDRAGQEALFHRIKGFALNKCQESAG
jgi:MoxR-like ATPase